MKTHQQVQIYKIITIGNDSIGKSCFLQRYAYGVYPRDFKLFDFMIKKVTLENKEEVKLEI